eukprot:TRINITY_DN5088_c0_g1_i1.p1 TRINITY_DN5088_c0_g1~~TRINITY_DN5088_c0_g1_i1.p1  ORF type:complete len:188 (-),score=41.54 TRINITY_DN5088_c0_g1_i1:3-566(-)
MQFVVLITDGAVHNERKIVLDARQNAEGARVLTFGIGSYCNWYFLKMLALETRGWSSGTVFTEDLQTKMAAMLKRADQPVLSNVTLGITSVQDVELYPPRIPDLFVGGPILVAGKYRGDFPGSINVRGMLADGQRFEIVVGTDRSEVVPVHRVFLKQRVDMLVAQNWLYQDGEGAGRSSETAKAHRG